MADNDGVLSGCDSRVNAGSLLRERRQFIQAVMAGGAVWATDCLFVAPWAFAAESESARGRIRVDYSRCAGCRTCEAVCAQANNPECSAGQTLWGLGNPRRASIHVYHFSRDIDIPVVCVRCVDAPCTLSCPVPPDGDGHRAIYRDAASGSIISDPDRCIGCRQCAHTCREKRVGAIVDDPQTGRPSRLCSLCDGDPKCVRYCPYGALSVESSPAEPAHQLMPVASLADKLEREWYQQSDR